ncbi:iron-regulated frpA domain protein [Neisseria meningitidis]|nr:iron-regulated frpA domain protein [Neisseria meningitidis]
MYLEIYEKQENLNLMIFNKQLVIYSLLLVMDYNNIKQQTEANGI